MRPPASPSTSAASDAGGDRSPDASGPVYEPAPDAEPSPSDATDSGGDDASAAAATPFAMTPAMWAIGGLAALAVVALVVSSGDGYSPSDADVY